MEYLFHILAALGLQAAVESGLEFDLGLRWLPLVLLAVPQALAQAARAVSVRGHFRAGAALFLALQACPPVLHALALSLGSWRATIGGALGTQASLLDWPGPTLLLSFAPFVLYTLLAIDARARALERGAQAAARVRHFHVRAFLTALAPLALWGLAAWPIGAHEPLRVHIEEVRLVGLPFLVVLLAFFVLALPRLVESGWDTRELEPGPMRRDLEGVAQRARFRFGKLLVWRTGNLVANAAIVGVLPAQRRVLFSDLILAVLSSRELAAVFAHEIGHARRKHVLVFLAWTAAFFLAADSIANQVEDPAPAVGLALALFAAWYTLFGWLSRRFELEADLVALELVGDPQALIGALEKVGGAHGRARSSWRHFSVERRTEFIARAAQDARVGRGLTRKLRLCAGCGFLGLIGALAFEGRRMAVDYHAECVRAQLRLGRYAEALGHARQAGVLEPDISELVARAAELQSAGVPGEVTDLEEAATRALDQGDLERTVATLALAALRGSEPAAAAVLALELAIDGEVERARRELERSAPRWLGVLDAAQARP